MKAAGPPPIRNRRAIPLLRRVGIVAALLLTGLILFLVNRTLFFRVISIGSTALLILSIAAMLLTFRKRRRITPLPLVIAMLTSLTSSVIYSWLLDVRFSPGLVVASLACGALLGTGWALTTPLRTNKGVVEREGNLWYLAAWGVIFTLNQLTLIATGRPPRITMLLLLVGTGTVIGNSLSYIVSYYSLKAKA